MPGRAQRLVQLGQHVRGGDVHAGDGLGRDDQPAHRRRRCRHRVQHAVLEQFGVGEEQRRVPAKQDQAGDPAGIGIARDVVVALDAVGAPEHRGVRTPAVPQEFDDGDHDGQADARNRAQHRDAGEAARWTARTPIAGCDRCGAGRATSNRPIAEAITTAASALSGRCWSRSGAATSSSATAQRADDAGQLRPGARGLGDRRARRAAADRKALEESGGEVGRPEPHHLLVGVDIRAGPRGIGAREHAGVGERHEGDRAAADQRPARYRRR